MRTLLVILVFVVMIAVYGLAGSDDLQAMREARSLSIGFLQGAER